MESEWQKYKISDVGKVITGKTPPGTLEKYFGGDTLFVTPGDMCEQKFIKETARTLSSSGKDTVKKVLFDQGIVVSCIGWQMGKSALIKQWAATNQQINTIIVDERVIDIDFLYYILKSKREEIFQLGATATRTPIVKKSLFEKISFLAPDLIEQKKISLCLSPLDDKIELNRRMNATLEAMAQALFKSWFVDFDPVIDNALAAGHPIPEPLQERAEARAALGDQRQPLPEAIRQQFPNHFVCNEDMGWVPEGWKFVKLGKVTDLNWGDTSTTKQSYVDKGFQAYSAKGPDGYLSYFDFDRTGVVVSAIGANSGFTWLATGQWSCIKNTIRFWSTDEQIPTEYLFFVTRGNEKWPLRGSAQPFIAQADARNMSILKPSGHTAIIFSANVAKLLDKIHKNSMMIEKLSTLRDTLLPKLLSGQLRIPEAEQQGADML